MKIEGYEKITKAFTISQLDENVGEEHIVLLQLIQR